MGAVVRTEKWCTEMIISKIFKNNIRNLKILSFMSCQFGLFLRNRFFTFLTFSVKSDAFDFECGKFAAFQ